MAEAYRFFGGTVDDPRQYNQIEFAEVLERFFQNGYFPDIGGELQVTETDPPRLAIRVASGQAWINGYWYKNDDWKEIDLAPADVTYARIDRVVLRLDTVNDRNILAIVKTGTPSATPVAPDLERTEQYWELGLATIYVAAGVTSVTNANITDTRHQDYECGKAVPRNPEFKNHLNDDTAHGVNTKVSKFGDTMTGSLSITSTYPFYIKLSGKKTWGFHRSGDNLYIAPSASNDGTDLDWSKQTVFYPDGKVSFSGIVGAKGNTSYTVRQFRNIILSTSAPSGGENGDIWLQYE